MHVRNLARGARRELAPRSSRISFALSRRELVLAAAALRL
jgi:hypothetical protein